MTKSMLAGLAAVSAGLCFGDVTSANTVGYINDNITKGNFNAVGVSFTSVDGKGIQLDSITGAGLYGSTDPEAADQIRIWNPLTSGYEVWYYYVDGSDDDGWWDYLTQSMRFSDVHPEGLANGTAVWLLSSNDAKGEAATLSGAVDVAKTVTLTLTKGNFNQVANPFPIGLQLNNAEQVDWSNAFGSMDPEAADQIRIWNPLTSGYEVWYLYIDGTDDDGWWDYLTQSSKFEEVHPNGLDAGVPVWYLAAGTLGQTFDVTFKTPMK